MSGDPFGANHAYRTTLSYLAIAVREHKSEVIGMVGGEVITHASRTGIETALGVCSYTDGIQVGCTFVTNGALEKIYELHTTFLKQTTEKRHQ